MWYAVLRRNENACFDENGEPEWEGSYEIIKYNREEEIETCLEILKTGFNRYEKAELYAYEDGLKIAKKNRSQNAF